MGGMIAALIISAIIGVVGSVATGYANYKAQEKANDANVQAVEDTNDTNLEIAQMTNQFNADQAQINRDWQTQMANTAHQREMADLKAAGLNPILTATGGTGAAIGSSNVAQGNSARMQAPQVAPQMITGINSALSSMTNMIQGMANLKLLNARLDLMKDHYSHMDSSYDMMNLGKAQSYKSYLDQKLLNSNVMNSVKKEMKPYMNSAKGAGKIAEHISDEDWESLMKTLL